MLSILAVDDLPSMRKMVTFTFTLTGAGHRVVEAAEGQGACGKAQVHSGDLVLADQNMPNLDGIGLGMGLARKVRKHPLCKTTPIPMLTPESGDQSKQAGRSAGATGWRVKPFDSHRRIQVMRKGVC